MAKIKLGSFIESIAVNDITPEQKAEVAYQETVKMLELNKRIEELGASIKFLESREPQIIKENFHTKTVVEKELPQIIKEVYHSEVVAGEIDFSQIESSLQKVSNELNATCQELDNRLNDVLEQTDVEYKQLEARIYSLHKTTEIVANKAFDLDKNLKKQLKTQKIINILLAVGFIISLFR